MPVCRRIYSLPVGTSQSRSDSECRLRHHLGQHESSHTADKLFSSKQLDPVVFAADVSEISKGLWFHRQDPESQSVQCDPTQF
jgi:hypothetical protein